VAVAIPVSVIATFMLIYFKGFTLNIMTIGGLALGVGMLVDNAIVVVENILRIRDSGKSRVKAALLGSSEVTSAVIASTMTTLVVFLPLIFMRGMIGLMFQQLAYVVGFSLLCSLVAAISLVPMLCSKILKATKNNNLTIKNSENHSLLNRLFGITEKIFISIENAYKNLLELCLKNRIKVIIICFLILFFSGLLIPYIGTELNPEVDENEIRLTCEMEVGTRVEMVLEKCAYVHKILEKTVPELRCYQSYIGGTPWRPGDSSRAQIRVSLIPRAERKRSDVQIAEALTKAFEKIPGMTIRVRRGQGLFIMNMATRGMERIGIEVRGHDFETSGAIAQQIEQLIQDIPGITDIRLSRTAGTPEELLLIDREKAEELNLSIQQIGEALKTAVSGSRAGQYKDDGDEFNILVKMNEAKSLSLHEVLDLTVSNTKGVPVALRNVISSQTGTGPVVIERTDQERIVDLRVNIRGRDLGSIIADIREKIKDIVIPKNYYINFSGSYEEQQKAFLELTFSFILAVLLVYMVMASQFESLLDPLVVMFSLPFASIGVILTLFLTDTTLNMQSFIGCIMLAGIVVNNAILLVDYTNLLRTREELDLGDAIAEAGRRRLRPILMTALTTSLALIPLGLGLGEGGEAQAPMARAVIGGLLSSTLVTLVIIPVVYSLTERFRKSKKGYQDVQ
jgi:HAE1 family hydrophobic/amphiphilic exporter-1